MRQLVVARLDLGGREAVMALVVGQDGVGDGRTGLLGGDEDAVERALRRGDLSGQAFGADGAGRQRDGKTHRRRKQQVFLTHFDFSRDGRETRFSWRPGRAPLSLRVGERDARFNRTSVRYFPAPIHRLAAGLARKSSPGCPRDGQPGRSLQPAGDDKAEAAFQGFPKNLRLGAGWPFFAGIR